MARQTVAGLDKKLDRIIQANDYDQKWREEVKEVLLTHVRQDDSRFQEILLNLRGDGEEKLGLVTRVKLLEEEAANRKAHIRALWITILGFFSGLGLTFFK